MPFKNVTLLIFAIQKVCQFISKLYETPTGVDLFAVVQPVNITTPKNSTECKILDKTSDFTSL